MQVVRLGGGFGKREGGHGGGRQGRTGDGLAHSHKGRMRHHVECVPIVPLRDGEAGKFSTGSLSFFGWELPLGCQLPATSGLS